MSSTLVERRTAASDRRSHARRPTHEPAPPGRGGRRSVPPALVGLLLAVGVVHAVGMSSWPPWFDDEGTYVAHAWAVGSAHELAHYTYWYDHPPLGWLQLAAWVWPTEALSRTWSVVAGREAMLLVHLVASLLLYVVARRLGVRPLFAGVAVALFSFSPLALHYHRMVLLDNIAVAWLLAAFALALTPARRLAAFGGSGACFAVAVLSKETMLVLLPALVVQVWLHADPRTRAICLTVFGSLFTLTAAFYPLYATLKGELLPGSGHVSLVDAVAFQLFTRRPSGFVWDPQSDAHAIVRGWAQLDPWLLSVGAIAAVGLLAARRHRAVAIALLTGLLLLLRPGYLPIPYVVVLIPFAALLVAAAADLLTRARRAGAPVGAALVVLGAVAIGPSWASALERQTVRTARAPEEGAITWVSRHVPRTRSLIVDNTVWVDLVRRGYPRERVVWFSKLDLDPGVLGRYARGYRTFDYILWSEAMRVAPDAPRSRAAYEHSCLVRRFGHGRTRVEVRRIDPDGDRRECPSG